MSAYYIHDGHNEIGPFSLDLLKKQKLTRNTPIRKLGTDNWMPAERLAPLKELVVPRKIRRPKDILPAAKEHFHYLQQRKPVLLYSLLLLAALLSGISIYSVTRAKVKEEPKPASMNVLPAVMSQPLVQPEIVAPKEAAKPPIEEDKAKLTRKHWKKLIAASNSNYGIGFLGGIKDLSVIVTNRTDFPIDQAVAKVTYIKANGSIWKTKLITMTGIPAHESKEQPVPDVGRGKKVKVSIQKIVSRKMKFSYTEGQKIKDPDDPYVIQ